ncbi:MAG: hypothetical protein Q8P15_02055 [Nanoarchaeota archaeon]|nr:hypothetical protein [Nanoarchaeota archaeon]
MNQKYVFLQALIITIVVFNIGVFLGYKLEASRIDKINEWYLESEMELLDQRIQEIALDLVDLNCDAVIQENINFADRIFQEALTIRDYEEANKINSDIIFQHKRYDLLRTLFWMESMKIKEKCNADYHNIVYLYQYNNVPLEKDAAQDVFSNFLSQIKQEKGNNVMLIPIAADNDLPSVNLLLDRYNITELPVIFVDEKYKFESIDSLQNIKDYLN